MAAKKPGSHFVNLSRLHDSTKEKTIYDILVKLILGISLLQFGLSLKDIGECSSRECLRTIEKGSKEAARIDWKPISIFPTEAKRFNERDK